MRGPIKRGAAAVGNANIKIIMLKNVVIINVVTFFGTGLFVPMQGTGACYKIRKSKFVP